MSTFAASLSYGRRVPRVLVLAFGAVLLAGCAVVPNKPEDIVRDRAQQRWEALIRGDTAAAWRLHGHAWRTLNPLASWQARLAPNIEWREGQVKSVQCDRDPVARCVVRVLVRYRIRDDASVGPVLERELVEAWVQSEGSWWHVPSN